MSANDARRKAEENRNKYCIKELSRVNEEISDAVTNGKSFMCKKGGLLPETRQKLKEAGYSVQTNLQYNESYYTIRW